MSQVVRISDVEMKAVRAEAAVTGRSIAGQAEHWLRLGRAVEANAAFNYKGIQLVLQGLASPDDLSRDEQEIFLEEFAARMRSPGPTEEAYFADRQRSGLGVGMNAAGEIVACVPRRGG